MENRNGQLVDLRVDQADGLAKNKLAGFMVGATYNLLRIAKRLPLPEPA